MKRLTTITLTLMLSVIYIHAQKLELTRFSDKENPKIQELFKMANELCKKGQLNQAYQEVEYSSDSKGLIKTATLDISEYDLDEHQEFNKESQTVCQNIIKAVEKLSHEAADCYHKESHHDGTDSLRYTLVMKKDESKIETNPHNRYFLHSPNIQEFLELVKTSKKADKPHDQTSHLRLIHYVVVDTSFVLTNGFSQETFNEAIQPIMKQKGVTARKVHYQHDKALLGEMSQFPGLPKVSFMYAVTSDQNKGESTGTHYIVDSTEQGEQIAQQLQEAIATYIQKHPDVRFNYYIDDSFPSRVMAIHFNGIFGTVNESPKSFEYYINKDRSGRYHFFFLDVTGDIFIPGDYEIVKDMYNTTFTYYNKDRVKGMTYECDKTNK